MWNESLRYIPLKITVKTLERLSSYGVTVTTNKQYKLPVNTPRGMQAIEHSKRAEIEITSSPRPIFPFVFVGYGCPSPLSRLAQEQGMPISSHQRHQNLISKMKETKINHLSTNFQHIRGCKPSVNPYGTSSPLGVTG